MRDGNPDERSLPDWIKTVYAVLAPQIRARDAGLPPDKTGERLLEDAPEDLSLTPADADYALQRLIDRGYFYEVKGELLVTDATDSAEEISKTE
jgi:hypothetical protein